MARFQIIGQFACVLLLTCVAIAQPPHRPPNGGLPDGPPGGRDREGGGRDGGGRENGGRDGQRDPFFEALREVPNKDLFDLVNHTEICKEIGLSEASAEKVKQKIHRAIEEILAIRNATRDQAKSPDELKQMIRERVSPLYDSSYELLRMESNFQRLLGIYVQARQYRAALNDQVANAIGLEGTELDDFRTARTEAWRSIMEETRSTIEKEMRHSPPGTSPREAIGKQIALAEKKLDAKLAELLTPAQREQLELLKGKDFPLSATLNEPPPDRRRGPPGERPRDPKRGEEKPLRETQENCPDDKCCANSSSQLVGI